MKKSKSPDRPASVMRRRWQKFRTLKRGWYSFLLLLGAYVLSFASPLLINNQALIVSHDGELRFPIFADHIEAIDLGQRKIGAPNYRDLKAQYEKANEGDWVLMPLYPYGPIESLLSDASFIGKRPPRHPTVCTGWAPTTAAATSWRAWSTASRPRSASASRSCCSPT